MDQIAVPGFPEVKLGPKFSGRAQTRKEKKRRYKQRKREKRLECLAVLDLETDPFSDGSERILPFCAELYSDQFGSIVIWEEDYETLVEKLLCAIENLPNSYIIYAHNGGKFDFMFFVHKLRGTVRFKGRAIMSAKIGKHELRDSLHILPEKLAAWKKERFDYRKMVRSNRQKFRDEILAYLHSDCIYLFDFIKRFTKEFGLKISIGQAAFAELKKHYKIAPIKESMDTALRTYFLGGRVECIAGMGEFEARSWEKSYKLYDVNSMYPYVMATKKHPISTSYVWHRGSPNENTIFIDLNCRSYGAFFHRLETGEVCCDNHEGRFYTTIWEYQVALKHKLIENVQINWVVDNMDRSDFSSFIVPMYDRREETKRLLKTFPVGSTDYEEIKKENIFLKYLMNNAYGKTAQNPRKYKEFCYTDHNIKPDKEWFEFLEGADDEMRHEYSFPVERTETFDVWARPSPGSRFNNVGTGASITGAARAILLDATQHAIDPIYCDTDSLICRDLSGLELSPTKLGAWDLEETFDSVIIAGKKTYCCKIAGKDNGQEGRLKVRSKGADLRIRPTDLEHWQRKPFDAEPTADDWRIANEKTWQRYLEILDGKIIEWISVAPTFYKTGEQYFMRRRIRATAPLKERRFNASDNRIQNDTRRVSKNR